MRDRWYRTQRVQTRERRAVTLAPCSRGRRLGLASIALVAFCVTTAPLVARNLEHGCSPLHNESFTHYNLVTFNRPAADGVHYSLPAEGMCRRLIREGGGTPLGTLRATVRSHRTALGWPLLVLWKLRAFWSGYEARNNLDPHLGRRLFFSLRYLPSLSLILLPLGLLGLFVGAPRLRRLWPAYAGLGVVVATCLAAGALARYRAPGFPFLAIFAALACGKLMTGNGKDRLLLLALLLGATLLAKPLQSTAREEFQVEAFLAFTRDTAGDPSRAQQHAVRAVLLHPFSKGSLSHVPDGQRWEEYLGMIREAYRLSQEVGAQEDAMRMRAKLARHLPLLRSNQQGRRSR